MGNSAENIKQKGEWESVQLELAVFPEFPHIHPFAWGIRFLEAIHRICNNVDWLSENLPGNLSSFEWRHNAILELEKHQSEGLPNPNPFDGYRYSPLVLEFHLLSAIVDSRESISIGLEQIRAALLITVLYYRSQTLEEINERISFIASGIRGTFPNRSRAIGEIAFKLPNCQTAAELIIAVNFPENRAVDFALQWEQWVLPALKSISSNRNEEPETTIKLKRIRLPDDKDIEIKIVRGPVYIGPQIQIELGEPPEDAVSSVITIDSAIHIDSPAQMRTEKYLAGQRIWDGNPLLLQSHSSILPTTLFRQVVETLIDTLEAVTPELQIDKLSLLALFISGITGRAEDALAQIHIVENKSQIKMMGKVYICLESGYLYQPMLVPKSAFKPKYGQQDNLEPVENYVIIPLPKRLLSVLLSNKSWRGQLFSDKSKVADRLIEACEWLRTTMKLKTFRAEFRKALAPAIFATCRDVAQVMQICSDTFGLSQAPLYYYAPQRLLLAKTYKDALQKYLGLESANIIDADFYGRVGSKLLIKNSGNWHVNSIYPRFPHKSASNLDMKVTAEIHNRLMDIVAGHFVFIVGHRPVDALFEIKFSDIDMYYGSAIISDKKVDTAHITRLVGLPAFVIKQLQLYIVHLRCLAGLVGPHSKYIEDVLKGIKPFLFRLTSEGAPVQPSISDWKSSLKLKKSSPPPNFGRTLIRTYGAEEGADPEALSIQLGHLEAVGYPFSAESPTEPLAFLESINPVLERLANRSGWRLRKGLYDLNVSHDIPCTRLLNWDKRIKEHHETTDKMQSEYRQMIRARSRSYREDAKIIILDVIGQTNNDLAEAIGNWPSQISNELSEPSVDQVAVWRQLISERSENDTILCIACMREFWNALYKIKKRKKWTFKLPMAQLNAGRQMDSPFMTGMMDSIRQIQLIRNDIESNKSRSISRCLEVDFARVAVILVVAGYIDTIDEVIGVLQNRCKYQRISTMDGYLLVPHGDRTDQVTGLYGLAAISLAWLAKKYPVQSIPDIAALEEQVAILLPVELSANKRSALTDLCSTMSVANRIELSPMARVALNRKNGCRDAPISQQIAFLENRDVYFQEENEGTDSRDVVSHDKLKIEKSHNSGWKKSYQRLIDIIPSAYRSSAYMETEHKVSIEQSNAKAGRDSTINALEHFIHNNNENWNVRVLAIWTKDMLVYGTERTQNPAYSTVFTYLTSIARPLLIFCNGVALTEMTDTDLEVIYSDIVESKPRNNQGVAARSLWNFHESLVATLNVPAIDFSILAIYMADKNISIDNQLITRRQIDKSIATVLQDIEYENEQQTLGTITGSSELNRRILNQVCVHLITKEATGGRVGEIMGAKLADFSTNNKSIILNIGSNRHRRLKTRAARRKIEFAHRLQPELHDHVTRWLSAELATLPKTRSTQAYLMGEAGKRNSLNYRNMVNTAAAQYLRLATGRRTERQHRIRHLVAQESIVLICIHPLFLPKLNHLCNSLSHVDIPLNGLIMPWHLHSQSELLGHTRFLTTLMVYFHFSWITRIRSDVRLRNLVNRSSIANIFGVSLGAVDKLLKGSSIDNRINHVLDKLNASSNSDVVKLEAEVKKIPTICGGNNQSNIQMRSLFEFFNAVGKYRHIESVGLSYGFRSADVRRIMSEAKLLKAKSGFDLLLDSSGNGLARNIRDIQEFTDLNVLLDWTESANENVDGQSIFKLAVEYFLWNKHNSRDPMRFRVKDLQVIKSTVTKLGYYAEIQMDEKSELFLYLVVRKLDVKVSANQYLRRIFAVVCIGVELRT